MRLSEDNSTLAGIESSDINADGSFTIPAGVTSIGSYAFMNCTGLARITTPDGVTSIGNGAFAGCIGLTEITILAGVTSIGNGAFAGCIGLTEITIPAGVTSIGDSAFIHCTGLTRITIPASVTSIGSYAFYGCAGLTEIAIPAGVTGIGNGAFYGCAGLTEIAIPARVTSIGNGAFMNCTGLRRITIPAGVTSIGNDAFRGCAGLTEITIPARVTSIGNDAFRVGDRAFYGCTGLTEITIPAGVTSIGNGAFYGCTGLREITIPAGVTSIGDGAFVNCTGLTQITILAGVTSIGNGAFMNCTGLRRITIPAGVTSIGNHAFNRCRRLTEITIPAGVTSIGDNAFYGCTGLAEITIPAGVTSIGNEAFYNCIELTEITIPAGVTSIGNSAFIHCTGLTRITIPAGVTSIGNQAFYNCIELTEITIDSDDAAVRERILNLLPDDLWHLVPDAPAPPVRPIAAHIGVLRYTHERTQSAEQVRQAAADVARFYSLPPDRHGYDTAGMAERDASHGGPQMRKMAYLYRHLEENDFIPKTTVDILSAIDRLVTYANSINEESFGGALPGQSRRMFKIGVDRLLRKNERVTQTKDWNSRALLLGLFRKLEDFERKSTKGDKEVLQGLNLAFITGVRHVIEADRGDGRCLDSVCTSARTSGFFAGDAEVRNLTSIHPHCHGRLKNLSVNLASILGYPETLGEELQQLLSTITPEVREMLISRLTGYDECEPHTTTTTVDLYPAGIDNGILAALFQIKQYGRAPEVSDESAAQIQHRLLLDGSVDSPALKRVRR